MASFLILNGLGIYSIVENTKADIPEDPFEKITIFGFIRDNDTLQGIQDAIVSLFIDFGIDLILVDSIITDNSGYYSIQTYEIGLFYINASADGYIDNGQNILCNVLEGLYQVDINLDSVKQINNPPEINSESPTNESVDTSISITELSAFISDTDGDILDWAIETSPNIGLSSGQTVDGAITCNIPPLDYSTTYTWFVNVTDGANSDNATFTFTTEDEPIGTVDISCDKTPLVIGLDENTTLTFTVTYEGETVNGKLRIDNMTDRGNYNQTWIITNFNGIIDQGGITSLEVDVIDGIAIVNDVTADDLYSGATEKNITFWFKPNNGDYARANGQLPVQIPDVSPSSQFIPLGQTSIVTLTASGRGQNLEGIFIGLDGCGLEFTNNDGFTGSNGTIQFSITPTTTGIIDIHVIDEGRIIDSKIFVTSWALDIDTAISVIEEGDFNVIITNLHNGNPVEGANVELVGIGTITTDSNGQATFVAPSVSSDTDFQIIATKNGYLSDSSTIRIINVPSLVVLAPAEVNENSFFTVNITDEFGNPVENVSVELVDSGVENGTTNNSGCVEFTAPDVYNNTTYSIIAQKEGYLNGFSQIEIINIQLEIENITSNNTIICGYITDISNSSPIINAQVNFYWIWNNYNLLLENSTFTNAQGFFKIDIDEIVNDQFLIFVEAEGYFTNYIQEEEIIENDTLWMNISLNPGAPESSSKICGYINDSATGNPIENALVIMQWDEYYYYYMLKINFSDDNGFYNIYVPAGHGVLVIYADGYYAENKLYYFYSNETIWANFSLNLLPPDTSTICGYITDEETGEPVKDIEILVRIYYENGFGIYNITQTDSYGFYSINVPSEEIEISISIDDVRYYDFYEWFEYIIIEENGVRWINITLEPRPEKNSILCGYVKNKDTGEPVNNAYIEINLRDENGHYSWDEIYTDSNGYFTINIAAGEIDLYISAEGYFSEYNEYDDITIGENENLIVNITLMPYPLENSKIEGLVLDANTGVKIETAYISLSWRDEQGHYDSNSTFTDANGSYSMNIAAGEIDLYISAEGYFSEYNEYDDITIGENETLIINISLYPRPEKNSVICGQITDDSTGQSISGVDIYIEWKDNYGHSEQWYTYSNSSGFYSKNVAEGQIRLSFYDYEYFDYITEWFNISEGETIWINISLSSKYIIDLIVNDAKDGKLDLSWEIDNSEVTIDHFNIYRDGYYLTTVTTTSYQDTGLVNGQYYQYHVIAADDTYGIIGYSYYVYGTPTASQNNNDDNNNDDNGNTGDTGTTGTTESTDQPITEPADDYASGEVVDTDNTDEEDEENQEPIPNNPPIKPDFTGPTEGNTNVEYSYTANSTDPDGHQIKYFIEWGDGSNTVTEYLPSGTSITRKHKWTKPGIYHVSVAAFDDYDNGNGSWSKKAYLTVLIDSYKINGELQGYLVDTDNDGRYELFYDEKTNIETLVQMQDELTYIIDTNNDNEGDYIYDLSLDSATPIKSEVEENSKVNNISTELIIFVIITITSIALIGIAYYMFRKNKTNIEPEKEEFE